MGWVSDPASGTVDLPEDTPSSLNKEANESESLIEQKPQDLDEQEQPIELQDQEQNQIYEQDTQDNLLDHEVQNDAEESSARQEETNQDAKDSTGSGAALDARGEEQVVGHEEHREGHILFCPMDNNFKYHLRPRTKFFRVWNWQ